MRAVRRLDMFMNARYRDASHDSKPEFAINFNAISNHRELHEMSSQQMNAWAGFDTSVSTQHGHRNWNGSATAVDDENLAAGFVFDSAQFTDQFEPYGQLQHVGVSSNDLPNTNAFQALIRRPTCSEQANAYEKPLRARRTEFNVPDSGSRHKYTACTSAQESEEFKSIANASCFDTAVYSNSGIFDGTTTPAPDFSSYQPTYYGGVGLIPTMSVATFQMSGSFNSCGTYGDLNSPDSLYNSFSPIPVLSRPMANFTPLNVQDETIDAWWARAHDGCDVNAPQLSRTFSLDGLPREFTTWVPDTFPSNQAIGKSSKMASSATVSPKLLILRPSPSASDSASQTSSSDGSLKASRPSRPKTYAADRPRRKLPSHPMGHLGAPDVSRSEYTSRGLATNPALQSKSSNNSKRKQHSNVTNSSHPKSQSRSLTSKAEKDKSNKDSVLLAASQPRDVMDEFLVSSRLAGMSYRDIRRTGAFSEVESTLRGRFRTLTKEKEERVRRPTWTSSDNRLLRKAVRRLTLTSEGSKAKIPWKKVAEYIYNNGGSYQFGNATCRKQWDELCGDDS